MTGVWHYNTKDGRAEEKFSDAQVATDGQVVKKFEALEGMVAAEKDPNTNKDTVKQILEQIATLPENRKKHWLEELKRIGVVTK